MKRLVIGLTAVAALLSVQGGTAGAAGISDYSNGTAANGIVNSRHNLGSVGKVLRVAEGTTEICVFCHTPHHSAVSNIAPLWNRVNAVSSYTPYGQTAAGTSISSVGGSSLACLSCHDGVTTFDTLINAPGRGGISPGGQDQNWAFQMGGLSSPVPGFASNVAFHKFDSGAGGVCSACHNSSFALSAFAQEPMRLNIGTSMANDHPVSVEYPAVSSGATGIASLRPKETTLSSVVGSLTERGSLLGELAASAETAFGGNLNQNRWAVKGIINDGATIADLLRNGKVECTSCHDPHFKNMSWDEAEPTWKVISYGWCSDNKEACSDGNFLRRVGGNTGSGVCRTCHNK